MAERLSGAPVSQKIQAEIIAELSMWSAKKWAYPKLTVILVGDDPASQVYVSHKEKMCHTLGFVSEIKRLDRTISEAELIAEVNKLNNDDSVDAILVQLPLPKIMNERRVLESIQANKDADCLTETNLGRVLTGTGVVLPCTPSGVLEILKFYKKDLKGKNIAVVGRSLIVGIPLFHLLNKENATVTLFHSQSENLLEQIKKFDIVCIAIGKAHFFKAKDFKHDAIIVDVGIHRLENKLTGDVDFSDADLNLKAYTPVPGGVGPMTIAMLMKNTLSLAKEHRR